jgi:hypothetical protein
LKLFTQPEVKAVFESYPVDLKARLLYLRHLIFSVASESAVIGPLTETLKWGQPGYLTEQSKSGVTVRIDGIKPEKNQIADSYGLYVHCNTSLVSDWRDIFQDVLAFEGNRCIRFSIEEDPPEDALRHCIEMALTYHLKPSRTKKIA